MGTRRLVQAIAEPARDELEVTARKPQHEYRGLADVVDGIGQRHRLRKHAARLLGAHRLVRHHQHRRQPCRDRDPRDARLRADHEAAVQGRRRVVGMALLQRGDRQQVRRLAGQLRRGHEARDGRGGARPQTAAQGDVRADTEAIRRRVQQLLEPAHAQIAAVLGDLEVRLDVELAGRDLVGEGERQGGVRPAAGARHPGQGPVRVNVSSRTSFSHSRMASSKLPPSQLMNETSTFWPSASSPASVDDESLIVAVTGLTIMWSVAPVAVIVTCWVEVVMPSETVTS